MLLAALEAIEQNSVDLLVDVDRDPTLCSLSRNCHQVLQDLQDLKAHFDGIGTQAQLTWERMGWGTDELADIRARLLSYIGTLNLFNAKSYEVYHTRISSFMLTNLLIIILVRLKQGSNTC